MSAVNYKTLSKMLRRSPNKVVSWFQPRSDGVLIFIGNRKTRTAKLAIHSSDDEYVVEDLDIGRMWPSFSIEVDEEFWIKGCWASLLTDHSTRMIDERFLSMRISNTRRVMPEPVS